MPRINFFNYLNGLIKTHYAKIWSSHYLFDQVEKMEQEIYSIGNPTTLLLERIFWLGIGGFFGVALFTSLLRQIIERKNKTTFVKPNQLENLAKKAVQRNLDSKWYFHQIFLWPQAPLLIITGARTEQ